MWHYDNNNILQILENVEKKNYVVYLLTLKYIYVA